LNKKYLFLANSSKPDEAEYISTDPVKLNNFYLPNIEVALRNGYEVNVGINRKYPDLVKSEHPIHFFDSNIFRSIFDLKNNYKAYRNLNNLLNASHFDIIHCNTPIGGVLGRICGKKAKVDKVIYTVHGFHFYRGQNIIKKNIFRLVERALARMTDVIITINEEDYINAKNFKLKKGGKVFKISGVGLDTNPILTQDSKIFSLMNEFSIKDSDIVLLTVGDLVKNKNTITLIKCMKYLDNNFKLIICGKGVLEQKLKFFVKKQRLEDRIIFTGYRSDINDFYELANIFVFSSFREGLPRVTMEAMAHGLPCIVSNIRGNVDLIDHELGGYLCKPKSYKEFAHRIKSISYDKDKVNSMKLWNERKIKNYDVEVVRKQIQNVYNEMLEER